MNVLAALLYQSSKLKANTKRHPVNHILMSYNCFILKKRLQHILHILPSTNHFNKSLTPSLPLQNFLKCASDNLAAFSKVVPVRQTLNILLSFLLFLSCTRLICKFLLSDLINHFLMSLAFSNLVPVGQLGFHNFHKVEFFAHVGRLAFSSLFFENFHLIYPLIFHLFVSND